MQVDDLLIDKLSALAALEFQGAEREGLKQDLNRILAYVETINGADTTGVTPLIHLTQEVNHFRTEDVPEPSPSKADALRNAPRHDSDYFRVPRVVDKQ